MAGASVVVNDSLIVVLDLLRVGIQYAFSSFEDLVPKKKRLIMEKHMEGNIDNLAHIMKKIEDAELMLTPCTQGEKLNFSRLLNHKGEKGVIQSEDKDITLRQGKWVLCSHCYEIFPYVPEGCKWGVNRKYPHNYSLAAIVFYF